ncbi:hypothetical protein MCOR27_006303 [Pyricularia oryzae]|uniref:CFEM domain-containing protein n=2 Tax=Pyricularia TaxID=48558 RepID=A0ABQ8NRT8_PYRGI|nr:hypothetical protein MCOR01_008520 [Pyricularia oryzae]KAI6301218.1 hypothetical protein MCOR33_003166 [Pyricularia grisea]KAH9439162.1 hypothetical protein MCOR02_002732 [Pyricularia oryzae]KAI6254056.1 hypothetical protein MCOR19_009403 [Pyricularia oryzae]KAI6266396.1 hypothetical protein MCOR26_010222 [Pyricularia oryzae]
MQFRTLIVSFFAAVAVAQTPTSGSSAPSGTSGSSGNLVSTVNDLPRCALGCLKTAAEAINCNPANFKCLCSNTQALLGSVGPCALSACNSGDVGKLTDAAAKVCQQINANPPPAQVASASNIVASAIATQGSSRGGPSSTPAQGAAPKRTDAPVYAVMGGAAAVWAVYAM